MARESILGIDLSLRALGLFACPIDYDGNWSRANAVTLGVDLPKGASAIQYVERLRMLTVDVVEFAYRNAVTIAFVESYAFDMTTMAHSLGEIGGVIKLALWKEKRIEVKTANQNSARKLVFGRCPPKGMTQSQRKAWLFEPLKLAGLPVGDHNQGDAAVVAVFGMHELGIPTIGGLLGEPEVKAKRSRKKAA